MMAKRWSLSVTRQHSRNWSGLEALALWQSVLAGLGECRNLRIATSTGTTLHWAVAGRSAREPHLQDLAAKGSGEAGTTWMPALMRQEHVKVSLRCETRLIKQTM